MAVQAKNPEHKAQLINMAETWEMLATARARQLRSRRVLESPVSPSPLYTGIEVARTSARALVMPGVSCKTMFNNGLWTSRRPFKPPL